MKKTISRIFCLLICGSINTYLKAQCATTINGGSSTNMFTIIRNNTNPIAASKELNTIVFVHRNNHNVFGGHSGHIRYDISTNGGGTWTNNQGVLNPSTNTLGRYPNAVIHNPAGNTAPSNAYFGYMASTTDGSNWNGYVSGTQKINGSLSGESFTQPNPMSLIAGSLVKGAPGIYWAIDYSSNGVSPTGNILVYKGTWNGSSHINWATNTVLSPGFNVSYYGFAVLGDMNIAFDPTGTVGWISLITHLNSGPGGYNFYPVFYKTTNAGATWSGPITVNLGQLSCISANLSQGAPAATNFSGDLAVDVYGNPHLLTTVGSGNGTYGLNYYAWHHMMDITQKNGIWTAHDISDVTGGPETFSGQSNAVTWDMAPQLARTADGKKLFFGWTDSWTYSMGDPNAWPDFHGRGLDVSQNLMTNVKDFTSCNGSTYGSIYFPHMAEEVLEPSNGVYKLAVAYANFTNSDPEQAANMKFLNNVTFSTNDFNVNLPGLNLNLSPTGTIVLCPSVAANAQISGNFGQVLWSNGSSSNNTSILTPGTYYVAARSGCLIGADSLTARSMTLNSQITSALPCAGQSVALSVNGNAGGYTWTPGNVPGPTATFVAAGNSVYTITASGYNCTMNHTMQVNVLPSPNVIALTNRQVACAGDEVILQASGASLYVWSNGATTYSISDYPQTTTDYTVTGLNSSGCSKSFTLTQNVNACVGIESFGTEDAPVLFPNPTDGILYLNAHKAMKVTLINSLGQTGPSFRIGSGAATMDLQGLPAGVYTALIEHDGRTRAQKIILH